MEKSKMFNTMQNIGKVKYVVNFYDGVQTHKDGSPFWGIATFKNKKKLKDVKKTGKTSLHIGKTTLTALQITWFLTWIWTKDDSQEAKPKTVLRPGFSANPPLYRGKGGPSVPGTLRSPFYLDHRSN